MNMVAPNRNEILTTSDGNSSAVSDYYQHILSNRQSIKVFTKKLFEVGICDVRTAPKHMTVTRIPRGSKARVLHH